MFNRKEINQLKSDISELKESIKLIKEETGITEYRGIFSALLCDPRNLTKRIRSLEDFVNGLGYEYRKTSESSGYVKINKKTKIV